MSIDERKATYVERDAAFGPAYAALCVDKTWSAFVPGDDGEGIAALAAPVKKQKRAAK